MSERRRTRRTSEVGGRLALALAFVAGATAARAAAPQDPPQPADPAEHAARAAADATNVATAAEALARGDLTRAQRALDATPMDGRGFEWRHVSLAVALARAPGIASGARSRSGQNVDVDRARVEPVTMLAGHSAACHAVRFSPDGARLASASSDRSLRLWNARTGDLAWRATTFEGAVTSVAFAPDGERVVAGSEDGSARVFEVLAGTPLGVLRAGVGPVRAVAWSPDGKSIATAPGDGTIRLWPADASEARLALRPAGGVVSVLAFAPDSTRVAGLCADGSSSVFDVASGATLGRTKPPALTTIAYAPAGDRLLAGGPFGGVRALDPNGANALALVNASTRAVLGLDWTSDGDRVAVVDEGGTTTILDGRRLSPLAVLATSAKPTRAVTFSPRGDRLATCGDDGLVRILETDPDVARAAQRGAIRPLPSATEAEHLKPLEVDLLCSRVVQRPGLDPGLYAAAEDLARAMLERLPESGQIQTTIGGAEFRLGRFESALSTLTEAGEKKRGWPANLAFRTLTLVELQRGDEAQAMLARLATLLKEERWARDAEAGALYEEARLAIAARAPAKK